MIHDLKCWERFYKHIEDGSKPFEIRLNDRDYQVGDVLHLREFNDLDGVFTGRSIEVRVVYILRDFVGLKEGYIAMTIHLMYDGRTLEERVVEMQNRAVSISAFRLDEEKVPA